MKPFALAALTAGLLFAKAPLALSQSAPPMPAPVMVTPATPNDYSDGKSWLCRPGRDDVCRQSVQDATIVTADGTLTPEPFHAAAAAPVDCFYVYPTVSKDPGGNATMAIALEERSVINQQFARFAAKCRPYAPLYRQVTLTALRSAMMGKPMAADRALAYQDVLDAWTYYLKNDNHGRGVVLIGHSQGSGVLIQLIKQEIDGKPVQARMISAILGGARLQVPVGKDVGGDFQSIPLCRSASQTGCAINFASFRVDSPPPSYSRFGGSSAPGLEAACVNPAALAGGSGALKAYLAAGTDAIVSDGTGKTMAWTTPPSPITTPFVAVPGLLTGECVRSGGFTYLAITTHPGATDRRVGTITGDVMVGGQVLKDWGLHLIDMNLTMGNMLDLVDSQSKAYLNGAR
jgi:Protein of unknown function (DUF3089)